MQSQPVSHLRTSSMPIVPPQQDLVLCKTYSRNLELHLRKDADVRLLVLQLPQGAMKEQLVA